MAGSSPIQCSRAAERTCVFSPVSFGFSLEILYLDGAFLTENRVQQLSVARTNCHTSQCKTQGRTGLGSEWSEWSLLSSAAKARPKRPSEILTLWDDRRDTSRQFTIIRICRFRKEDTDGHRWTQQVPAFFCQLSDEAIPPGFREAGLRNRGSSNSNELRTDLQAKSALTSAASQACHAMPFHQDDIGRLCPWPVRSMETYMMRVVRWSLRLVATWVGTVG